MHHHGHCLPAHHCHTPCSPSPFAQQALWNPALFRPVLNNDPPLLPRSCSSSSSDDTDVSCKVHVEEPSTAAPLLEPRPDGGAAASWQRILFGVIFWAIFAWIVYSYWF